MNFKKRDFKETDELFKASKILPFQLCKELNSSKLLWQVQNSCLDSPVKSLFTDRGNGSFHLPFRRTELTQSSIAYSGVQTWNKIPSEIRMSSSLNVFKEKYKDYLLERL